MPPITITVSGQQVVVGDREDYKDYLACAGVQYLSLEDGGIIAGFGALADGGTYTLGPPIQLQRRPQEPATKILNESAVAALNEMAEDYVAKKRTIRLSDATQGAKAELMDMLSLPEKGSSWPNKPSISHRVDGFVWRRGEEDSEENRQAYMDYLRNMLLIPANYDLADVHPNKLLLSVELFRGLEESRKVSGTTDVAIARSEHVRNDAVRNNIETLLELKTIQKMKQKDHSPQAIGEHFAASYLNPNHAVVAVLTDLNTKWVFFWYALREEDSTMSLYKLKLDGNDAATHAKYLLDSLYGNSNVDTLPDTFEKRQPFQAVLNHISSRKRARTEHDGDSGTPPDQDSERSSSGRVEQCPDSTNYPANGNDVSRQQSNQSGRSGGAAGSKSMADVLSLFAPATDRDVANELDLLDMVDVNEQHQILSSFALKHVVPYMRGWH